MIERHVKDVVNLLTPIVFSPFSLINLIFQFSLLSFIIFVFSSFHVMVVYTFQSVCALF